MGPFQQQLLFSFARISGPLQLPVMSVDPRQQMVFAQLEMNRGGLVQIKGHVGK